MWAYQDRRLVRRATAPLPWACRKVPAVSRAVPWPECPAYGRVAARVRPRAPRCKIVPASREQASIVRALDRLPLAGPQKTPRRSTEPIFGPSSNDIPAPARGDCRFAYTGLTCFTKLQYDRVGSIGLDA